MNHNQKNQGNYINDVIIGFGDGVTVPFALSAGLVGFAASPQTIIIAGLAAIIGGSFAMGFGGYAARKSHATQTPKQPGSQPDQGKEKEFFANIGLSEEMQARAVEELARDQQEWEEFVTKYELNEEPSAGNKNRNSALAVGFAYAAGGLVPLIPYFIFADSMTGLKISAALSLSCLFVFGYLKSRFAGINPWSGAALVTIIGTLAAGAAYGVGRIFNL